MLTLKKSFFISGAILLALITLKHQKDNIFQYIKHTNRGDIPQVLFNNEELIPPFTRDTNSYHVISASTLKPNILQIGDIKKEIKIENFETNPSIPLDVNGQKINIHLYPKEYPKYSMKQFSKSTTNNAITITSFDPNCTKPSFNFIVSEKGKILFYRRTRLELCASDFKQTTLPNGEKVYSYMQQEKPVPPFHYLSGSLVVMNSQFDVIDKLTIQETDKHPALMVENHDSLILDKNHFVLSAYHETEIFHPETEEPTFVAQTVLQEIKDGKVIFDWVSSDYPHLYTYFKSPDNSRTYNDYMHFNSIIVDPKDNNLIISCAGISSILKINRKTGDIMWTLGGPGDDFKLDEQHHFYGQHSLSFDKEGNLMLFDNQSHYFAQRIEKSPKLPHSRILKFKLDEKNKKILNAVSIPLDFQTDTMGSVYQTAEDTYILAMGGHNKVQKIKVVEEKATKLWELSLDYPTYRAYEVKD
ncbi:MAG: aryl-sulfate sulfotransferase [Alphaproteobacteria bacterium]|nr:aryl-sulfate sulfotransferase [Alphaproteobacteria bacterium]